MNIPQQQASTPNFLSLGSLFILLAVPLAASPGKNKITGVACEGRIVPAPRVVQVGAAPGTLVEVVRVKPGDMVSTNALLATLQGRGVAEWRLTAALAELEAARNHTVRMENETRLAVAAEELRISRLESTWMDLLERSKRMEVEPEALERARQELAAQQTELAQMEKQLPLLKAELQAQVALAQAQADADTRSSSRKANFAAIQLAEATAARTAQDAEGRIAVMRSRLPVLAAALAELESRANRPLVPPGELEYARQASDTAAKNLPYYLELQNSLLQDAYLRLRVAEAAVEVARANLAASEVKAPFSGEILAIHTMAGESVGPQGILSLADTRNMQVDAYLYASDLPRVFANMKAEITGEALPEPLTGRLLSWERQVLPSTLQSLDPSAMTDRRVVRAVIVLDAPEKVRHLVHAQVTVRLFP